MKMNLDPLCYETFQKLKYRKDDILYLIFNIVNEKVVIEKVGSKDKGWVQFLSSFPIDDNRYGIYDVNFKNSDNMDISKIIFINWCPDDTKIKHKMLFATAKEDFKKQLDINGREFTLTDHKELTEEQLIKELSK